MQLYVFIMPRIHNLEAIKWYVIESLPIKGYNNFLVDSWYSS